MKKIKWPTHPVIMASIAFCFNEKEELLLVKQKDRDFWSPPSGEVEKNESPEETAIRETKEEINLGIKVIKTLKPTIRWQNEYENAIVVLFNFLCEIEGGEIKHMETHEPQYDVTAHKWISLNNISKNKIEIAQNILDLIGELKDNLRHFKNGRFTET